MQKNTLGCLKFLLGWFRVKLWVWFPVQAVRINELEAKGQGALDGSTVHLQILRADAYKGATLIKLLSRLVITFVVVAHH